MERELFNVGVEVHCPGVNVDLRMDTVLCVPFSVMGNVRLIT